MMPAIFGKVEYNAPDGIIHDTAGYMAVIYAGLFATAAYNGIIVQGAVNAFGSVYIAGFSAAGKIQNIVSTVFVAFGAAAATYVGQNRGAGRMDRVHQGVKSIQIMILVWSAVMILVIHLFGDMLIRIFIDASETEVMDAASTYFRRHV